MSVYERDGRWMVAYSDEHGKRKDKSFGRGDHAYQLAEQFDQAMKAARKNEVVATIPAAPVVAPGYEAMAVTGYSSPSRVMLGTLAMHYLSHLKASGGSPKHIGILTSLLFNQFIPAIGDKLVDTMTYTGDILPFILSLQGGVSRTGRPRSSNTVNRYCDYLDAVFNFGLAQGLTSVNPVKGRKKSKELPWDLKMTVDDLKKIMDHAEPHLKWAMEVCFNLGTRPGPSELLALRYADVDWEAGNIRIYATKTKSYRTVPLAPTFLNRLKAMEPKSFSGFIIEYKGKALSSVRKAFRAACERAGISVPVKMYDLRHLFATTMLSKGADLAAVSKLMGHSTIKMTADTYYHYMTGEKERAVNLLPDLAAA